MEIIDVEGFEIKDIKRDIQKRIKAIKKAYEISKFQGTLESLYIGLTQQQWDGILGDINNGRFHYEIANKTRIILLLW